MTMMRIYLCKNATEWHTAFFLVYHEDVNSDQDTFKWKSLQVKTFEDSLPILAQPFVIVTISNGRQEFSYAELQPGIEEEAYGDLLDSYSEVVAFGTYQIDGLWFFNSIAW